MVYLAHSCAITPISTRKLLIFFPLANIQKYELNTIINNLYIFFRYVVFFTLIVFIVSISTNTINNLAN